MAQGGNRVILTPNEIEFQRLCKSIKIDASVVSKEEEIFFTENFGNVIITDGPIESFGKAAQVISLA